MNAADPVERLMTDDASYTCTSRRYRQSYHSSHGALTEARHIYLQGAQLPGRLERRAVTRVLEIGFGLGLNFLVTADEALARDAALQYVASEHTLISAGLFDSLDYRRWLRSPSLADALSDAISSVHGSDAPVCGDPPARLLAPRIALTLDTGDATARRWERSSFDVVYLDPFSADVNPECWQPDFLARLHSALAGDGVLVSYSVRGSVTRALASVGFQVEKLPGPPGKRHMLRATPYPV